MKIYLSHPIRGANRNVSPVEEKRIMARNNVKAIEFGEFIRDTFSVEVYIPAEHEEIILLAYEGGYLDENGILDLDCAILRKCDAVIFYLHEYVYSNGMKKEHDEAHVSRIPHCEVFPNDYESILVPFIERLRNGQPKTE